MKHIVYSLDTGVRDLILSDCEPCTGPINRTYFYSWVVNTIKILSYVLSIIIFLV